MFGSQGSGPGQFNHPNDVAYDSSGIVYVANCFNHRVQSFSADGQFISSFASGSEGSQPGQFYHPRLRAHVICIDSTDTEYVTDENHHVSAFSTNGKFLKYFGKGRTRLQELICPIGMTEDNTTGNLYVCDHLYHCVVCHSKIQQ